MSHRRPNPLLWLMAPLIWLERARGRWRLGLLLVYLVATAVVGVLLWRATSLWNLPDAGDPFDVAAFGTVKIPEDQNAFTDYRKAAERLKPLPDSELQAIFSGRGRVSASTWSTAVSSEKDELSRNTEALDLWLRGTDCPDAVYVQPGDLRMETQLPVNQELRTFARIALLEASRREQAGDMAGAWRYYRGVLRSSRHIGMHGMIIQRLVGKAILNMASGPTQTWATDSRVDVPTLRQALRDVGALDAMTAQNSVMIKIEYIFTRHALGEPMRFVGDFQALNWYEHVPGFWQSVFFLKREPERSRRIMQQACANYLSQCDLSRTARKPLGGGPIQFYPANPGDISREALSAWVMSSTLSRDLLFAIGPVMSAADSDRLAVSGLQILLAEELYRREHGKVPKTLGDLIGPDFRSLPDEYPAESPPLNITPQAGSTQIDSKISVNVRPPPSRSGRRRPEAAG